MKRWADGGPVAAAIVTDPRVGMITFTGSPAIGEEITRRAGIKKITLELGSNSAVVLMDDANLDAAIPRIATGAFAVAGQVCISAQRVFVHESLWETFRERFVARVNELKLGDPLKEDTDVGPMISEKAAQRAEEWVLEAVNAGAKVLTGGKREGTLFSPTVLTDVEPQMKVCCEEAFAPLVSLIPFHDPADAFALVNDSKFGLQAGIYTHDIARAFEAARNLDVGGVMINEIPMFRVDLMPYGGTKDSGLGREGPKYAVEEMTEIRLVCFNL